MRCVIDRISDQIRHAREQAQALSSGIQTVPQLSRQSSIASNLGSDVSYGSASSLRRQISLNKNDIERRDTW